MKHTRIKRIFSLMLAVLLALGVPCSMAGAATKSVPVICIPDIMDIVLYQNPNTLTAKEVLNTDSASFISCAVNFFAGMLAAEANTEKGVQLVSTAVRDLFNPIAMNNKGESVNPNLGAWKYRAPATYNRNEEIYTENVAALIKNAGKDLDEDEIYVFTYDWRLDPTQNADALEAYIDNVKSWESKSKVSVIAGGTGCNVLNAYLYRHLTHAKSNLVSCLFLDSAATGSSIIGDLMSGHLVNTVKDELQDIASISDIINVYDALTGADVGDAFVRFLQQDPGGIICKVLQTAMGENGKYAELVSWIALKITGYILNDQGFFDKVGKGYKQLLVLTKDGIYAGGLSEYIRNIPGLWALVPEEQYEDAIDFLYGSEDEITPELLKKITNYRNCLESTEQTLKKAQINGINVCVVTGYEVQILPFTASMDEQANGLNATRYTGMGVTTGDIDSTVTLYGQCAYVNHNHVEPNKCLDASTCYLPENTWFIKGHSHMDFASDTCAQFLIWLITNRTQKNVWQSTAFPQYMQKAILGGKVYAYSKPDDTERYSYTYGDADVDGAITASDARQILRYTVGLDSTPSKVMVLVCDVNGNGRIDADDARMALRYSVGLESNLATF